MAELIGFYVLGMVAGILITLAIVPEREIKRYCDETEHGSNPL